MEKASSPKDDHEYLVVLGKSLTTTDDEQQDEHQGGDVLVSFGYEFQPASVDKNTPGLVSVDDSNGVQVLMGSSTGAAGGVNFKGKLVEHKDTDCLLIFDGSGFRLERCPFSCTQLRHVRAPTPRRRVRIQPEQASDASLVSKEADESVESTTGATKKKPLRRSNLAGTKRSKTTGRPRGRPRGSTKAAIAATKARLKEDDGI